MLGMQPVPNKRFARSTFALRNFIFMMRKCQVDSARVNVQRLAQVLHGHRRTLDVPARPAASDLRLPKMLARLWRLPQCEVARALLFIAVVVHARTRLNSRQINLRE